MIVTDLTFLHPDGREERVQGGNLASFRAGQILMRGLFEFARQFELFFSVGTSTQPLVLSQSHVRHRERIRKNPLFDSVWVENPGDRQELILIDAKTGKVHVANGTPFLIPSTLNPSMFRANPPCSLPKAIVFQGPAAQVMVEYPKPGDRLGLCSKGQPVTTQIPRTLTLSLADAAALGLLDPDSIDLIEDFCGAGTGANTAIKLGKAFTAPMVERLAKVLIAFDKQNKVKIGVTRQIMAERIESLLHQVANAGPDYAIDQDALIDVVKDMVWGTGDVEELRRAMAVIIFNKLPEKQIVVEPPEPDLLKILFDHAGAPLASEQTPEGEALKRDQFFLGRNPGIQVSPLLTIAKAMLDLVALSPNDQSDPLVVAARVAGMLAADIALSRFPVFAFPLIILESFATTDNGKDFVISMGSGLIGMKSGKLVRSKTGIDQKLAQAITDPRIKLSPRLILGFSTVAGQTLETAVNQGVKGVVQEIRFIDRAKR